MPKGRIRHHHFGEGEYDESEQVIQQLLAEAGQPCPVEGSVAAQGQRRREAAPDVSAVQIAGDLSRLRQAHENFVSPGGVAAGWRAIAY